MSLTGAVRYVVAELADHCDDPIWRRKRVADRLDRPVHTRWHGTDGLDVMGADWDTLVVLDACRADLFEARALDGGAGERWDGTWTRAPPTDPTPFDGYRRVVSRGSATSEWVRRNFAGGAFGDTVYVSANPYVVRHAGDAFHEVVPVWEEAFDESAGTVVPGAVADAARAALDRHPQKRVIAHFMQPHYPFLGHPDLQFAGVDAGQVLDERDATPAGEPHDPWEALSLGRVDPERVRRAYADNLDAVLGSALAVARADEAGRAVVSSDHGNLLGERAWPVPVRLYGHPVGVRHPALVEVPWAVVEGDRREVRDDGTRAMSEDDREAVDERLRRLGYRE